MKNILKYSALAALLISLAALSGCRKEVLSTDQFGDGVTFASFAPNPAMRGGEFHIYGSNLQDISEVRLGGGVTVTDYTVVKSGRQAEITVKIPLEGPEPGTVSVVDKAGNVYSSLTAMTFTEAMEIDSFSPAEALSGDVITIKGEYLNIVREVFFGGDIVVTEFESQSRHELKVVLPPEAVTGLLRIGDVDETVDQTTIPNIVYSATELSVGDPTVVKAGKATYKAGDEVTVEGEHLDMIAEVNLEGASDVEFFYSEDATSIVFALPASATDGEIVLVSYAGKEFIAGEIETVSVADLEIKSLAEDGRYKAGSEVEIGGSDLDLVSKLEFTGAEASFYLNEGKLYAEIPATAKDGSVTLTLDSGKQAWTDAIEVVKPVVSAVSANAVVAGKDTVEVSGTDLDLVTEVKIGDAVQGFVACEFLLESAEKLLVGIPREAYDGPLTAVAANGYESASETVAVSYDESVSIVFDNPPFSLGKLISITGSNLLKIESITVKDKKVLNYASRSDDAMSFEIPDEVGPGVYRLGLTLVSGESLIWPVPFEITASYTETFIWQGSEDLSGWGNSPYLGAPNAFQDAGIAEGDVIRVYFTAYNDWWQFKNLAGHWDELSIAELDGGSTVNTDNFDTSSGYFAFNVTADILAKLTNQDTGWGGAYQCQGEGVIITGVSLIQYGATETVVWEGSEYTGDNYENNLSLGGEDDWVNAGLTQGSEIRIYFTTTDAENWQIQLFDGHWNSLGPDLNMPGDAANQFNAENSPQAVGNGYISFEANSGIYSKFTTKAWWGNAIIVQGKLVTVTKISFI